jgi:hypothetical protein
MPFERAHPKLARLGSRVLKPNLAVHTMESQALNEKASEETLISLLQLDPSPIESPLVDEIASDNKQLGQPSEDDAPGVKLPARTGTTTSSLGLSGHANHGAIYYRESTVPPGIAISASLD